MRSLRVAVLLLLLLGALPAEAAPAVQRVHRAWSFDGRGTGVLVVEGRVAYGRTPGTLATVVGEASGRGRPADVLVFPTVQDLGGPTASTRGAAGRRDLCADPLTTCRLEPDGELSFLTVFVSGSNAETESHLRFHLYAEGARVTVTDTLVGWRRTPVGGGRRVDEQTADAAGARAAGVSAGVLLSARAVGGRRGSIALAVPPCDAGGVGVAVLEGPGASATRPCPTSAFGAVARTAGTWTLRGPAAGVTAARTRLLVLDL